MGKARVMGFRFQALAFFCRFARSAVDIFECVRSFGHAVRSSISLAQLEERGIMVGGELGGDLQMLYSA